MDLDGVEATLAKQQPAPPPPAPLKHPTEPLYRLRLSRRPSATASHSPSFCRRPLYFFRSEGFLAGMAHTLVDKSALSQLQYRPSPGRRYT